MGSSDRDSVGKPVQITAAAVLLAPIVLTVPANKKWRINNVSFRLVTTGSAGNRLLQLRTTVGAIIQGFVEAGAVQAASLTRYYNFDPRLDDAVAFTASGQMFTTLPEILLAAGDTLTILDSAAVDAVDPVDYTLSVQEFSSGQ